MTKSELMALLAPLADDQEIGVESSVRIGEPDDEGRVETDVLDAHTIHGGYTMDFGETRPFLLQIHRNMSAFGRFNGEGEDVEH